MSTYYSRAVKRLAKRKGISITKARKLDWKKEADAERKRRSKASLGISTRKVSKPKPSKVLVRVQRKTRRPTASRRRTTAPPSRKSPRAVPSHVPRRKLDLRDYDQITPQDEEEFEDELDFQAEWEGEWESEWEELNDLDNLDGFMQDFEYEDSDKYKEPA